MTLPNPTFQRISDAIDERRESIVETLVEAVRIPTQTPPGENYDRIVEFYLPRFGALGFDARRVDIPDDVLRERLFSVHPNAHGVRANLLATRRSQDLPEMGIYCHMDTTEAGDLSKWTSPPFEPVIRDGYVIGRGTADSKGGCTAIYWGLRILDELGIAQAVSPIVALTTDEELGPYTGLTYLAESGTFNRCATFYSCDGMSNSIAIGCQGTIKWTIRIEGKSCHSSTPFMGLNPIEHSLALIDELVSLKGVVEQRRSSLKLSPEMREKAGRDRVAPALNITMAQAGWRPTAIPPELVLAGDRRYMPEESPEAAMAEIDAAVDRARARDPQLNCSVEYATTYVPFANDPDDPWIVAVAQLASHVRGAPVEIAALSGGTDVADVARVASAKIAIHGLADFVETRNHAPDERCRIDDMLNQARIVATLVAGAY